MVAGKAVAERIGWPFADSGATLGSFPRLARVRRGSSRPFGRASGVSQAFKVGWIVTRRRLAVIEFNAVTSIKLRSSFTSLQSSREISA